MVRSESLSLLRTVVELGRAVQIGHKYISIVESHVEYLISSPACAPSHLHRVFL